MLLLSPAQNRHHRTSHRPPFPPTTSPTFNLALDVGAPGAVASPMAQPNAEPEDDYEYVAILHCRRPVKRKEAGGSVITVADTLQL